MIVATSTREQTRARYPDEEGYVERDGVRVFWERYGEGEQTILLLPTWEIVHSRSGRCRSRTSRGTAASSLRRARQWPLRPAGTSPRRTPRASSRPTRWRCSTRRRSIGRSSSASRWARRRALMLAANHPERVDGPSSSARTAPAAGQPVPERTVHSWEEELDTDEGWAKHNRHYWLRDFEGYLEFFMSRCSPSRTPPSRSRTASAGAWKPTPETLALTYLAPFMEPEEHASWQGGSAARCSSSTATEDAHSSVRAGSPWPSTRAVGSRCWRARATRLTCATRSRSTSCCATSPASTPQPQRWTRGRSRRRRALFICSPIGLGHAQRDVAIARELRQLVPDLEIDWLAQHPVTACSRARASASTR